MAYEKNDKMTVKIEDIGSEGEGIGRAGGFTLFVKDAVVGDTVEAKILKSKKNYAYARLEKVLEASPFRVKPPCPFYRQCGGCQLQVLSYEKQLEFKQKKIRDNLIRIGGFEEDLIDGCMEPILGMDDPWRYRNKAQYPVGTDREGNLITGFYAGRTHNIISNTDCLLGVEENREILETVLEHMRKNGVSAYSEATGEGLIRHILIRKGFASGEMMVCFVINKKMTSASYEKMHGAKGKSMDLLCEYEFIPNQSELLKSLAHIKNMTSVSVNINTERTNVIMGKEIYVIWGKPTITDTIRMRDMEKKGFPFTGRELTFHISPLSFYQVNPVQTEKLYSTVLEYAGLTGQETVWDLYCGIGTISLFLAGSAKKVYGVEIIPQAIQDARENARRNNISNAEFFVGKAEEVLPAFYGKGSADSRCTEERNKFAAHSKEKAGICCGEAYSKPTPTSKEKAGICRMETYSESKAYSSDEEVGSGICDEMDHGMLHPDVIVVDPPRKGCDEACLVTMLKMCPRRIVYVSCDSATLARDLRILCDGGYEVKRIRGCDMFGQGVHVETVCLLSKLNVE